MTKKRSSEILADENREICRENVKSAQFFPESEKFVGIGGNPKLGKRIIASEVDGRPCYYLSRFLCDLSNHLVPAQSPRNSPLNYNYHLPTVTSKAKIATITGVPMTPMAANCRREDEEGIAEQCFLLDPTQDA